MAQTIVTQCRDYQTAIEVMQARNNCDIAKIDFTPNGGGYPVGSTWNTADYTGGNGTNQAGNGQCAMFDPRGGGMQFKPVSKSALFTTTSGAYGGQDANVSAFAGYPIFFMAYCITGFGTCGTAYDLPALTYKIPYLNKAVCTQINTVLQNNMTVTSNHELVMDNYSGTLFNNYNFYLNHACCSSGFFPYTAMPMEGCNTDYYGGNTVYAYMCPVLIR